MKHLTLCLGLGLLMTGVLPSCKMDTPSQSTEKNGTSAAQRKDQAQIIALLKGLQAPPSRTINYSRGARTVLSVPEGNSPYMDNEGVPVEVEENDNKPSVEKGVENGLPGEYVSTTRWYELSQTFDEALILDPTIDIAYTGCMLDGSSLTNGGYAAISGVDTEPTTISISTVPEDPEKIEEISTTIDHLRMSDYRKALARWGNGRYKEGNTSTMYSLNVCTNEWDWNNALGVAVGTKVFDLKTNLDIKHKKAKNVILAKFLQRTYSVTMDFPKGTTLINSFTNDLPTILGKTRPVYVSNINYGRIVLASIETDESLTDVQAALDFLLKTKVDLSVKADATIKRVLTNTRVNIALIGGSISGHSTVIKEQTLEKIKEYLSKPLPMHEAAPISMQMRYVHDNGMTRVISKLRYPITERTFVPNFKKLSMQVEVTGFSTRGGQFNCSKVWGSGYVQTPGQPKSRENIFNITEANQIRFKSDGTRQPFAGSDGGHRISITKPEGMSIKDFLNQRIEFGIDMKEHWLIRTHDYPRNTYGMTIGDLLARVSKGEDEVIVTGQNKDREIRVYFKVTKPDYEALPTTH